MSEKNSIAEISSFKGESAYVYGLKARAQRHHCPGYGTFDVMLPELERQKKLYCRASGPITNTAIYVKAIALAVAKNPGANTVLFKKMFWGYRAVKFKNVDVNLPITREVDGRLVTFIGTIRMADKKSLVEIQAELTHLQRCPESESAAITRIRKFSKMPLWLSLLVHWWMTKSPKFYIKQVGSCGMTLMQGKGDRFFPIGPTSAIVGFGVPSKAPVVDEGGQVVAMRTLKCVVMVDNYVVSGLVGAKLVQDLIELMERAEVFDD